MRSGGLLGSGGTDVHRRGDGCAECAAPEAHTLHREHGGALTSESSRSPCRGSFHLAMAARLCVHALADREAFAPQDLAALLITLDLVSHSAGRLLFSSGR